MEDLKQRRDEIVEKLKRINKQISDDMILNATKKELEDYIELIHSITLKLEKINEKIRKEEEN